MNSRFDVPQPGPGVRKKTGAKLSLILILVLIILAVLNPGKADFGEYAGNHLEELFGIQFAEEISGMIGQPLVESFTKRQNYILFSTFSIPNIQDAKSFIGDIEENRKFLGVFKIFFIEL